MSDMYGSGNQYGDANPYETANPAGTNADPEQQSGPSPAPAMNADEQVQNSMTNELPPTQGTPPMPNMSSTSTLCLDCISVSKTASKCSECGSTDLMTTAIEKYAWAAEDDKWPKSLEFSSGVTGIVGPNPNPKDEDYRDKWVWNIVRDGDVLALGYAQTSNQAMRLAETEAVTKFTLDPTVAGKTAADNPFAKKDDDKKSDAPADGSAPAPAPAKPATPTTDDQPTLQEGNQMADPAAPSAPVDNIQPTIQQAVDTLTQNGHDPLEIAYDADKLYSKWRCSLCQEEGEAQGSDDGSVDLSGDLFADQNPCAAAAVGAPLGDPTSDPNADPNAAPAPLADTSVTPAPDPNAIPGTGAPADPNAAPGAPVAPAPAPDDSDNPFKKKDDKDKKKESRRRWGRVAKRNDGLTFVAHLKKGDIVDLVVDPYVKEPEYGTVASVTALGEATVVVYDSGPVSYPSDHEVVVVNATINRIIGAILETNEGFGREAATTVAKQTLRKYPSLQQ